MDSLTLAIKDLIYATQMLAIWSKSDSTAKMELYREEIKYCEQRITDAIDSKIRQAIFSDRRDDHI